MSILKNLEAELKKQKLNLYFLPMADNFGSEYLSPEFRRIEAISNFTGSNAFLILNSSEKKHLFLTDGRYTTQAAIEVDSKQFEIGNVTKQNEIKYIKANFKKAVIGYDPALFSVSKIKDYEKELGKDFKLKPIFKNLIDSFWKNKPEKDISKAFKLQKKYSGKSFKQKHKEVFEKLEKTDYLFLNNAESICWLLNIRASDLPNTPVLLCYALINKNAEVVLYTNQQTEFSKSLGKKFNFKTLDNFASDIKTLKSKTIALDESEVNFAACNLIKKSGTKIHNITNPCVKLRAIKNPTEIKNTKLAHEKDGAALVKFFYWLENSLSKKQKLDELLIDKKLKEFRSENENFFSTSFDTIAGFKGNGAIIHYKANESSNTEIKGNGLLLIDSGAQYFEGTTDITRTIAIGKPTKEEITNFTLVLKGHIALAKTKFLKGTSGANLDILARQFLWNEGLDYKHGTGHGVGSFLNVHEGPQSINLRNTTKLETGMIISNEPGYYKVNKYGIRIESLVLVTESKHKDFLEFETISLCPIDLKLVDKKLLNKEEVDWLNNYHSKVFASLKKHLSIKEKEFLKQKTKQI